MRWTADSYAISHRRLAGPATRPALPPPLTTEEEACLIDAIGEPAMREVYGGQRSPNSVELEAFADCNVGGSDAVQIQLQMEFPDFELLPEVSVPMEIGTVVWPTSPQDASALLERLPDEISGHKLTERLAGPEISALTLIMVRTP